MPKINTYNLDNSISLDDYLIGSDGDNMKITKNYKVATLLDYLGSKYNIQSQDVFYTYTPTSAAQVGVGKISTNNYASAIKYMSAATNLYVSKTSALGNIVGDYLSSITSSSLTLIMMDMADPSNYAVCNLVSSSDATDNVTNISVEVTASNGTLISGRTIGLKLTAGSQFTGVDYLTLTQDSSIFMGLNAGDNDDGTNNSNIGIGVRALNSASNASSNIALGQSALQFLSGQSNSNISIGVFSSYNLSDSSFANIVIGSSSLNRILNTSYNIAIGESSLQDITSGVSNIAIGKNAGSSSNPSGTSKNTSNSIFLGNFTSPLSNTSSSNEIIIGNNITGDGSNTFKAGNSSLQSFRFGELKSNIAPLTVDRTVNWQDKDGTVAYTNDNFFASTVTPTTTSGTLITYAPDITIPANTLSTNGDILEYHYLFKSSGTTNLNALSVTLGLYVGLLSSPFSTSATGDIYYKVDGFIQRKTNTSASASYTITISAAATPNIKVLGIDNYSLQTNSFSASDLLFRVGIRDTNGNDEFKMINGYVKSTKAL